MSITLKGIHSAYLLSLRQTARKFQNATNDPEQVQWDWLQTTLSAQSGTAYGKAHGFDRIKSARQYQETVPLMDYDKLEPWVQRVAKGEANVLTSEPVLMMEKTTGSTSSNKFIPYTAGLKTDFSNATNPWLYDLFTSSKGLIGTQSYWSVSPATRNNETTEGGIPIGFEDDSEYFGPVSRFFIKKMMAVPGSVARLPSFEEWRSATLIHLLNSTDLGLISVWNPTFLTLLMDELKQNLPQYLKPLSAIRRREIESALDATGEFSGEAIWPKLGLISSWTSGNAATFIPALQAYFPNTTIQGKGLLATEGVISIPMWGHPGSVLAVNSHFLEFIDLDHPDDLPKLAHELEVGKRYSPIMSTSGGFYRYHLKDIIKCVGMYNGTPLIDFESKLDHISDICGEKLNSNQIFNAMNSAKESVGIQYDFATVAPIFSDKPHYCLFIETTEPDEKIRAFTQEIERQLLVGHHYSYCIELGQLGSLRYKNVKNGWQRYQNALVELGLRVGDIKPTHFDTRKIWKDVFEV